MNMDSQFAKILKLIKLTGEKVIVFKDDQEFVVSNLDDYTCLVSGTHPVMELSESQLLDKINRDIALWRESQKELTAKTENIFEPLNSTKPYYTPLSYSAQVEIDSLNDAIDDNTISAFGDDLATPAVDSNSSDTPKFEFNADKNMPIKDNINLKNNHTDNWEAPPADIARDASYNTINSPDRNLDVDLNNSLDKDYENQTFDDSLLEDGASPTVDSETFDSSNNSKEATANNSKVKPPRVNNFGYLNPIDAQTKKNIFSVDAAINIPPPPAIKK